MELEARPMLGLEDFDSESDAAAAAPQGPPALPRRGLAATAALLGATAVLALLSSSSGKAATAKLLAQVPDNAKFTMLDEADEDPCNHMPLLRIMGIKSNNLGGMGPDTDAPEGLIYQAESHNTGLNGADVEIHLHAVGESYFTHPGAEGQNLTNFSAEANYHPEWPKTNGITGHFGTINVHPGTNVTLVLRGYDPVAKKHIHLPKWAMTFFDLDTGKDGEHSVEFLKLKGFKNYFVSNSTELEVRKEMDGSTKFTGTVEGNGDDNPENPLHLTVLQKNRAVSFVFEDSEEIIFELGSSPGDAARVFQFVVRPVMRCAYTKLDNGTLLPVDDPNSPIFPVQGGTKPRGPAAALLTGLMLLVLGGRA